MPDLTGIVISNRYRVESSVGRGGMAEVYKVWDNQRAAYLAMKLLHEDLAEDRVFIRRFQREARTLARLQHPNIVRFYGLEQDGDQVFMLMDFVEGNTLRKEIARAGGPMPPERIDAILNPVCSALYYAHQRGMVHSDVKPANIMIDHFGKVLVTDFGIARMSEGATTTTLVGVGTPAYMSPEQVRGLDPTLQTDIYALGIVLYEMLTGGERPFTGERATITGTTGEKVRWEQINLPPPPLRHLNPAIAPELDAIVMKCLDKVPGRRYASAMELLNVMETALKEGGQRPAISTQPSATDGGQPAPEAVPGLPTHNHRLSWVWVSIVGFLTIAVVFFVVRNVFALIRPDFLTTRTSFAVASATNSQSQAPNLVPMNTDLLPTKATLQSTSITWMPTDTPEQIPTLPSIIYPSSDSPTGKIAFVCQLLGDEAEDQICLINSDGTNWQQLTNEADSKNYFPSISSDGNGVVYVSNRSGDFEIYEMDLSTRNSNQLTFGLGTLNAPEVSPDGQYIVFTNKTGGNMIWVMARDGKDPHQIFGLPRGFGWDPVWSPDGNKILFASGSVQKPNLSIMNADGSNVKVVLDIDGLSGRSDWSPDGQRIASYIGASWKREIITMNIDGSDLLQLTNGGNNLAPSFSPDGKWITFTSYRNNYRNDNGCEIYIMRIDGSDIRRLTNNSFCDYQPRWGP